MLPLIPSLAFLPFTLFVGLWVAWSDMRFMKIPNKAVLTLVAIYVVVGVLVLPLTFWAFGLGFGVVALVALFVANAAGLIGAGDAKFAAAMAPFFVLADYRLVVGLLAGCLLGAFAAHRLMRMIPAMRRATPEWQSWTHKKFPMGLALAGMLNFYLIIAPISSLLRSI
ncbi:MAG: prepilin peptidase [Cypionkella sp.]